MKLIYYSLILLIIVSIVLLSCKTQNSPPVGVHSGGVFPERIMGEEVKSIDELLDTFNLSEDQREAAEYLRKALVDDAKTYSNDTFYDLLSKLGADQVKTIVNNMLENHHLRLFYQARETIKRIKDSGAKKVLENRLVKAEGEYSLALKDYSDIGISVTERYNNILGNNKNAGSDFQGISDDADTEVDRQAEADRQEKTMLIEYLRNTAISAEITRVFAAHDTPEPADRYGMMKEVFAVIDHYAFKSQSHIRRRGLIYLAFDYKREDLDFFGTLLYKYIVYESVIGDTNALQKFFYIIGLNGVISIFHTLEEFSELYYLSSFKNLRDKEANLDKLDLEDLSTLKQQFVLLEIEKQKLVVIKNQIKVVDYNADVGGINTVSGRSDILKRFEVSKVLHNYLTDTTRDYKGKLNRAVEEVKKVNDVIIAILNKI
ncbi:BTA121 domain-containing protein surface lipoprotein [Borrelia persica]|uniref:BTA121 domain-containing protein surface lipoprotein n=2 Tax=Borrelia persica TaxID=44448 RepID=UPI00046495C9|nr:CRASP family complement regulator-acquiring lipoprotein [Borrelia persica]